MAHGFVVERCEQQNLAQRKRTLIRVLMFFVFVNLWSHSEGCNDFIKKRRKKTVMREENYFAWYIPDMEFAFAS